MKNQPLKRKFGFAWKGIVYATHTEANMRRHWVMAALVLLLFLWLQPSALWWALIILCISLVIAAELANSAIEVLIDHMHPELHPQIGRTKDMLAGMVLILSLCAGAIGLLAILATQGLLL
ncbi:MAG: diacylglycerol kinase [Sulfuricurvum sp.]|uniref:diacylglycerol kinase n=1 Tax=Sulfuricurvum sp. TaxID=2025608 RepID=UPI00260504FE|nr:diacylglycerol kinase [Sulfuricurvum sp.]MDD2369728.1 diacylglycerol kinase [Sulfuricurvum sp.]MDD5119580.1 diacylglycerol kinase [Sulfuricurvum sp.]